MIMRFILASSLLFLACGSETGTDKSGSNTIGNSGVHSDSNRRVVETSTATADKRIGPVSATHRLDTDGIERPRIRVVGATWSDGTRVALYEPPAREPAERARRRMNIDQLEAAFLRVSGGLNWTERRNGRDESLFRTLSVTLGKPDFIQTTNEVLEPTALFQKFLDDAARQVCGKMVERDQSSAQPILVPKDLSDDKVNDHLAHLVLRFHSRSLAENSPDLAQWRWLYDTVSAVENDQSLRWATVCTALFTHPDFYSF